MTESDCRGTDWNQLGQLDGITGNRPRIDQYAYQCSQHGVTANEPAYLDGWWTGNAIYDARVSGSRM